MAGSLQSPAAVPSAPVRLCCRKKLLFEMHLKRNGHLFVILLIYTITTITEPVHPSSNSTLHGERRSVLTSKGLGERINLDSKREQESRVFPFLNSEIQNKNGFKLHTNMASSLIGSIFKDRNKPKRSDPPNEECNEGEIELCTPGKFYIPGQFETNPVVGYHADSASGKILVLLYLLLVLRLFF